MLEHPKLIIKNWQSSIADGQNMRGREITDAAGAPVGVARQALPRWPRWLRRSAIEVLEYPDKSLLCALRPGWGWRVLDADERVVGTLRGRTQRDGFGLILAKLQRLDEHGTARFQTPDGRVIGEYQSKPDTVVMTFSSDLEGNPFARMLLLAAVVSGEW